MATMFRNSRQVQVVVLLMLSTAYFAAPLASQSVIANSISEPSPQVNQGTQEPVQRPVAEPKTERSTPASPEQQRQAQIEEETKKLYQLCVELRAEVGRTYKDTLSMTVLKKAGEVEALAKSLKVLMNREAAANH